MRGKTFAITLLTCSLAYGGVYVVKSGDTLSEILYSNVEGRIYGKNGNLNKLLSVNPQITNPNKIHAGDTISFPDSFRLISRKLADTFGVSTSDEKEQEKNSVKIESKKEDSLNQSLFFGLRFNSVSIAATESSSNEQEIATSDLAYGVFLRWTHKWNDKLDFFVDGSVSKYKFEVAETKTLDEDSFTKAFAGVGLKYKFNQKHSIDTSVGIGESFLLNSENSTELKIDKVVIPSMSFSGSHILASFKNGYGLQGTWRAGGLLPTSQSGFDTEFGTYWNVGLGSYYKQKNKIFNIAIGYGQRSLKTDNIEQTNKDISISAGIGFEF